MFEKWKIENYMSLCTYFCGILNLVSHCPAVKSDEPITFQKKISALVGIQINMWQTWRRKNCDLICFEQKTYENYVHVAGSQQLWPCTTLYSSHSADQGHTPTLLRLIDRKIDVRSLVLHLFQIKFITTVAYHKVLSGAKQQKKVPKRRSVCLRWL